MIPEALRKLCFSTKFPHQEIRLNFGVLRDIHFFEDNAALDRELIFLSPLVLKALEK